MCKTLFRFEDKYGMHSIVTSFKGIAKDASKNVKKTDAILDVPVLKQRLLEIDREIIEYLLGMSNNAFTLSELEVWLVEISHVRLWRNWQTRWI